MSLTLTRTLGAIATLTLASFAAQAADVAVSCEKRSTRSKVSVDGNNLAAGSYRAVVLSGLQTAASPFEAAVGDEAEFDFDSNPADIAAGATRISATFITDGRVRGYIVNSSGARVTPVVTAICRVRR
ncbi:hypothetical protein [Thermomonas sp.]|uniref:hypothetical protein n=1 Tax=Thermomonas sp. TaxID=1971895 RepID=UPI0035B18FB0